MADLHFFQPDQAATDWRMQIWDGTDWVERTAEIEPSDACQKIEIPSEAQGVRMAAIGPGGESEWSEPIFLPEPPIGASIFFAVLMLKLIRARLAR